MNRLLILLLGLILPLAVGCPATSGSDDDDTTAADDDDDAADDDDAVDSMCDDDDATPQDDCTLDPCSADADTGMVSGNLTDAQGNGLRCVSLTVCSDQTCLFGKTNDEGDWCVDGLPPNDYVMHNIDHPGENPQVNMRHWASFYDFVTIEANVETEHPNSQIIPFMPESARVQGPFDGDQELAWGDIEVSFNGDHLAIPFPAASCPDELELSAVEIPEAQWPHNGLMGWEVIGAYAFAPFELIQENAGGDEVPFDVTFTVGVQDDTMEYGLLFADYEHDISTGTFSTGTGALVGETIEGTVGRLSLILAVRR